MTNLTDYFCFSGLYDPVLDDTELTYVPIPQEEYEASNLQQVTSHLIDEEKQTLKQNNGKIDATHARETLKTTLEDKIRLKLKDAFQNINIEELPPTARFKLPISDDYDPEGKKMSKLQKFYNTNILSVDLTKVSEQIRQEVNKVAKNVKEIKQNLVNKEIEEEKTIRQHEMTKEEHQYSGTNQESISLKTIKETASQIVDSSINKAVDVAAELKRKLNVSSERKGFKERLNNTDIKDTEKQVKRSKISSSFDKKETKKVSFSDTIQEQEINEVNQMKKIEIGANTEIASTLTAEKRKLLTKQDIEEAIAPGTVRDRTAIFKKYNIMEDVIKQTDNKYEKFESKNRKAAASVTARMRYIKMGQQRAYSIGAQTILNIRRMQYPRCSEILLKTFWSKFTHVLVSLSKFTTVKPSHYFDFIRPEKVIERQEIQRRDGELIVKSKLSGAKIAQIEGMKPIELTNKMDIVISELQKKSGIEEHLNKEKKISQECNRKKIEDDIKRDYSESKSNVDENFYQDNSYKYDNTKFHTYETTKTQTMEIREIKTEKHISEYKRSKADSNLYEKKENENENITKTDTDLRETQERFMTTDDGKIIYVAIVEAHVYTNKDAIFEIHLRRLSENEKVMETKSTEQRDEIESIDKMKLYAEFNESRKQSFASTGLIEPEEEYSTQLESRPVRYIRSAADLEHVAKKIAVQNITQVIEPLLKLDAHKYDNSRHAHTIIEMPIRKTAEISDITSEEKQMYFQAQVFVEQKSYVSVEKPDKPIVEIKEIFVDEDNTEIIEESKVIVEEPQSTIEEPVKSIAETTELLINEEQITNIQAFEPIPMKPLPTIDITAKFVALSSEVLINEADIKLFDKPELVTKTSSAAIQKSSLAVAETTTTSSELNSEFLNISETRKELANIKMGENTATEVLQISPEEAKYEEIEAKSKTEQNSRVIVQKSAILPVAETSIILPEETSFEIPLTKVVDLKANINIEEMKAAEILTVPIQEPKHENLEISNMEEKLPQTLLESCVLTIAQTAAVLPEGPKDENLEIPEVTCQQTKTLLETHSLTAAESIITLPGGPKEGNLEINKFPIAEPNIDCEEFNATLATIISPEEPINDSLDIPKVTEKIPQITLEDPRHTVAEIISVIPASPILANFDITKPEEEKIQINYNELRSMETITVVPDEPKEDALDITKVSEKIPQTSMEGPLHTVAEIISVIPASPILPNIDITKPEEAKIQINYDELRSVETITVVPDEPKEDTLNIPKVSEKIPKTSMEGPLHTVAETISIMPSSTIDANFDITKPEVEKIQINYNELKPVETIMIVPEELSKNILDIPKITEKLPQMSMEGPLHTVAQTITIIPEGPINGSLDGRKPENEKIIIKYNELIPVQASTIIPEESIKDDLQLPKLLQKRPQVTTQETKLNIAETFTIIPEEPKDDVFEVSEVFPKKARIDIQELKAAETKIMSFEEKANENLKIPEVKQKTAIISTVEDHVTAKAKVPKLAIVDVSNEKRFEEIELNYTVELPKEEDEKIQEVFAEITITKQQTPPAEIFAEFEFNERKIDVYSDVSESVKLMNKHKYREESMDVSYSHTIKEEIKRIMKSCRYEAEFIRSGSSSPITPLIEEYMFKLQCPLLRRYLEEVFEEATLKLKSKVQKTNIQNFDASLTLILQDIAMSRESEEVDIAMESMKYVSSSDMSLQNIDNKTLSTSVETNVSSKMQSLHSGVAIASAATKHAIETGIDTSMLTIEQESLAEAKLSSAKKSLSMKAKAAKFESLQSKSSKVQSVEASYAHTENEATFVEQSLEAGMDISVQQQSFAVSQKQETELRSSVYAAERSNQSSGVSIEEISDEETLKASSFSKAKSIAADKKLSLRTNMTVEPDDVKYYSPLSPPTVPETPLVDEYVFRLDIPLPKESKFVHRDCSYSPDSIDDDIILKNGLIPHIKTKIYRILYSPPLPTPPTSPDKIIPIYGSGIKRSDKKDPNSSLFKFLS